MLRKPAGWSEKQAVRAVCWDPWYLFTWPSQLVELMVGKRNVRCSWIVLCVHERLCSPALPPDPDPSSSASPAPAYGPNRVWPSACPAALRSLAEGAEIHRTHKQKKGVFSNRQIDTDPLVNSRGMWEWRRARDLWKPAELAGEREPSCGYLEILNQEGSRELVTCSDHLQ